MQKFLADFIKRLSSRKFLVAVGGALTAYGNGQDKAAVGIIAAYLGVQGIVDAVTAWGEAKTQQHKLTLSTINGGSEIVPGGFGDDDPAGRVINPGN